MKRESEKEINKSNKFQKTEFGKKKVEQDLEEVEFGEEADEEKIDFGEELEVGEEEVELGEEEVKPVDEEPDEYEVSYTNHYYKTFVDTVPKEFINNVEKLLEFKHGLKQFKSGKKSDKELEKRLIDLSYETGITIMN